MLDFTQRPFNWLPLNGGDLFDLTCEYIISILERTNNQYFLLLSKAENLTDTIATANDFFFA